MKSIDFLPDKEKIFSETSWTITTDTTIDTTTGAVDPALPENVTLLAGTQRDETAKVMILRVKTLLVSENVTVTATGLWPLVILTDDEVLIDGTLDVGAYGATPGPGGSATGMGAGAGARSVHDSNSDDSGGGGGSFGGPGGDGGKAGNMASPAGEVYAITDKLVAGASGGRAAGTCSNPPGAGGGAIFIYAQKRIRVDGAILAGGGGGAGALNMSCAPGAGGGAGGGSGGAIWLQTADLGGRGLLAANGGGGGGGAIRLSNGTGSSGGNGSDGAPSVIMAAAGGTKGAPIADALATDGGAGAIQGTPPSMIPDLPAGNSNGGGGGGGLGHIVYRAPGLGALQSSPTAVAAP